MPDPFKIEGTSVGFSPAGISVPIINAFNPFTVADATVTLNGVGIPVTTGVRFRGTHDTGPRHEKFTYWDYMFDVGLKGEMGEFGDYFKTWNWETGFRYNRNEGRICPWVRPASLVCDRRCWIRTRLRPLILSGAFGLRNSNAAISQVYVNLHNTATYELPIYYATFNGDLFNLPAGPVSFALGGEYYGERWSRDPDSLNSTFQTIGSVDSEGSRVNRDVWSIYEEVRVPLTSPTWNFWGFYSFEVDFAEREQWFSQNTSAVLSTSQPAAHTTYNAQKPKISARWQPVDPKYIGAVTLRGSYTEAFHAPTLREMSIPLASRPSRWWSIRFLPRLSRRSRNALPEIPSCTRKLPMNGLTESVYSPKWIKGLTVSADWWHIDLRDIVATLGAQFIIQSTRPPNGASTITNPNGSQVTRSAW